MSGHVLLESIIVRKKDKKKKKNGAGQLHPLALTRSFDSSGQGARTKKTKHSMAWHGRLADTQVETHADGIHPSTDPHLCHPWFPVSWSIGMWRLAPRVTVCNLWGATQWSKYIHVLTPAQDAQQIHGPSLMEVPIFPSARSLKKLCLCLYLRLDQIKEFISCKLLGMYLACLVRAIPY